MAAGDLTTLAAVKLHMETTSGVLDDLIAQVITQASEAIQVWSGREIVSLDAVGTTRTFDISDDLLSCRYGEDRVIDVGDLAAVPTAVTVYDSNNVLAYTATVASDIVALPRVRRPDRPIRSLRLAPGVVLAPGGTLRVTGTWGFPQVPEFVERACILTVRAWLRSDAASSAEYGYEDGGRVVQTTPEGGWMLPMAAKQLLAPLRRII